jgi:4-hydroxyphenylacetate decarboxylase small subunit
MSTTGLVHRDCCNYAPLDADKGLCLMSKDVILADGQSCEQFSLLPRCRCCVHYQPDANQPQVGICKRSPNLFMAYADMTAKTCADYQSRK